MSFNLFGPSDKNDIRVGYISTTRGYVGNISRYEANLEAKLNPGTQFILRRRDKIEFMNINKVNELTPKDFIPTNSGTKGNCSGIIGLDIYEDDDGSGSGSGDGRGGDGRGGIKPEAYKDEFPKVRFSGGGGIGAAANPVFGDDGSLLGVDLIQGGWGYQYPPITSVLDIYGIGVGAVVRSIMIGDPDYSNRNRGGRGTGCDFIETVKTFENEEDFEEYDLSGGPAEIVFGKRRSADGEELGPWDPTIYATLRGNPVELQQRRYQDFLESLGRGQRVNLESNIIRNFWTTRSEKPLRVTAENKKSRIVHKVKYPAWSEFMNKHAVSPVPPSNVPGSDFGGIEHTLEWEEDFPVDGDYIFRYAADNIADIFLDNELIGRTRRFKDAPDKLKRYVREGVHRIRVDLENIPQFKSTTKQRKEERYVDTEFEIYGQGKEIHRQIKFSFTSEGGEHSFILNNTDRSNRSYKKNIRVLRNTNYNVVAVVDGCVENPRVKEKQFKLEYSGRVSPTAAKRVVSKGRTIEFDDNFSTPETFDINAKFKIASTSPGLTAKFSDDGTKLLVKGKDNGEVSISFEWDDDPRVSGIAVGTITIGDTTWTQSGKKGKITKTIKINNITNNKTNSGFVEQGTMQSFGRRDKEKGNKPSNVIFADFVGSENDNDDMQVRVNNPRQDTAFISSNPRVIKGIGPQGRDRRGTFDITFRLNVKPELRGSNSSDRGFDMEEIFNSKEFIDKADRKLWRINPEAGRDGDFLSRYGVLPFNPKSNKATTDDFNGTHVIRWEYVDFPITGNYNLEIMADDSVTVYIGNRSGGGRKNIGNGLVDVDEGGDEVIIKKEGFARGGRRGNFTTSTGKSFETRFFRAGKYRIRAELKQVRGKPLADGNPMAFAMRVRTTFKEKQVVSPRSWNQNPMGIALTIDSPLPAAPQEPRPQQEGRCPDNPFWTTRFPGSEDRWFPVTHPAWSSFTNRYAMSPILPLSKPDTDAGGEIFRTSWVVEAPYDGFYGMKGTVDNGGRILVDDKVILQGGLKFPGKTLKGFKEDFPDIVKFPLSKGKHTITVEVTNQETDTFKTVSKKIFSTKDWLSKPTEKSKAGSHKITYIGLNAANRDVKVRDTNVVREKAGSTSISISNRREYGIKYVGDANDFGKKLKTPRTILFDDNISDGFDLNASFQIMSHSPGIDVKFDPSGDKLIVKGREEGTVTLKFSYDDDPRNDGTAVKEIKLAGRTWRAKREKGSETITIDVTPLISTKSSQSVVKSTTTTVSQSGNRINVSSNGKKIKLRDGDGKDTNSTFEIVAGNATFSKDGREINGDGDVTIKLYWDDNPNTAGVAVEQIKIRGVTWTQSGRRGTQKQTVSLGKSKSLGLRPGSSVDGVKYKGPTELATYKKGFLSPLFQEINEPTDEIQGKTFIMRWENVKFPEDGRYKIETEADDRVEIFIDEVKVQTARLKQSTFGGDPKTYSTFTATKGNKTIEIRLRNIRIPNTSFQQNPTYVKTEITKDTKVSTGKGRPWTINPIGISAVIIPPPCPLTIVGKGKICKVVVDDPGNGFPTRDLTSDPTPSYPVTIELEDVEVINPGINYNCGVDQLVIEPSNGVKLTYECDTFGRITKVNVLPETPTTGIGTQGGPLNQAPFGRGFTRQPSIRMITDTGVNFQAVPRFRIVRDPVDPDILPEQILQVTDLVGLKQTGYIDGRPYYGQVFYKQGVRYAGVYETPGQLIPVYDTLQESIDAEVTTRPSAILRQGTDISSNDPRLNIPGTPDSLS